jgi:hypothetical protein
MVTPEDFRQQGDTTLLRLQRFLDAIGNGVNGELDADYIIPSQLVLGWKSNFLLHGNGHQIRLADGAPTGWGGSALYIVQCNDFRIKDLVCDGNRQKRAVAENPAHVIVVDKCHRWKFTRVQAVNGTCDGFHIYAGSDKNGTGPNGAVMLADCPSGWLLENCIALNNFRQGLSLIEGVDGLIDGGRYGLTNGLWNVGDGPCAGIDLEPDRNPARPQNRIRNIQLRNILFDQNQGPGLLITNIDGVQDVEVIDCVFEGNKKAAIESFGDNIRIVRPVIREWTHEAYTLRTNAPPKRGAIDIGYRAGSTKIVDPEFVSTRNGTSDLHPCIYVHGGAAEGIIITGIKTDGSASFICGAHAPKIQVSHSVVDLRSSTRANAFVFLGDYAVFEDMMLLGVYERAAYFGGKSPRIQNNRLYVRVAGSTTPVISAWDSAGPELRGNLVEFDRPVSSKAFSIGQDATAIDNKVINSLSDQAFEFASPPRLSSGNTRLTRQAKRPWK